MSHRGAWGLIFWAATKGLDDITQSVGKSTPCELNLDWWDIGYSTEWGKFPFLSSLWIALRFDFFLKIFWRSSRCWANIPAQRLQSVCSSLWNSGQHGSTSHHFVSHFFLLPSPYFLTFTILGLHAPNKLSALQSLSQAVFCRKAFLRESYGNSPHITEVLEFAPGPQESLSTFLCPGRLLNCIYKKPTPSGYQISPGNGVPW